MTVNQFIAVFLWSPIVINNNNDDDDEMVITIHTMVMPAII